MNERLNHLFISARDFDQSLDFFANVLGWKISETWGELGVSPRGACLIGDGGTSIMITEKTEPTEETSWVDLVCAEGF